MSIILKISWSITLKILPSQTQKIVPWLDLEVQELKHLGEGIKEKFRSEDMKGGSQKEKQSD